MGFVDEDADAPLVADRQAVQQRMQVEVMVVVADDHIGPTHQLLAEVVRADLMLERDRAQRRLIEEMQPQRARPRRGEAIVEALGQRTRIAMAGLVGMLAGLRARHELDDPQRYRFVALTQSCEGFQCHAPP